MKKFIVLIAFAICCILSGCEKWSAENRCYHMKYIMENGTSGECYKWCNDATIKWQEKRFEDLGYKDISVNQAISYKTFEDCHYQDTIINPCINFQGNVNPVVTSR